MFGAVELILGLLALSAVIYRYLTRTFDYWTSRGIEGPQPVIIFGTAKGLMRKISLGDYLNDIYKKWSKERYVGIFLRESPVLVLRDLDLIKDVLIKDFGVFADRGSPMYEKVEALSPHLFNLEPARWRPLRSKLSPVFTSGKLKEMFYLILECVEHYEKFIDDMFAKSGSDEMIVECRELTAKFTTDVIGVCAFGLQMNALASEESPFRVMGKRIFETSWKRTVQLKLRTLSPKLYEFVGHLLADSEMSDFFIDTMKQTMDHRKKNKVVRHDFIDLLLAIREHPEKLAEIELTDKILAAQLFVFFVAGFETSSSTMSNALYELAQNHAIQETARREIMKEMARTGGVIDYEGIKNMKYLDMVFRETLRKYPPATFLMRKSMEGYTFKDESMNDLLTIEKDQRIFIPIYAIQRDPEHFPNPDVFDPERFTVEARNSRHPMTDLSFGDGPRNCIGKRFGVMQTKVGLVKMLNNYKVDVCDKTEIPYINDPKAVLLAPVNGINLKLIKINGDGMNI